MLNWASADRDTLTAAYNNAAAVAGAADIVAGWAAASAALRTRAAGKFDLPYASGARTKWDIFPAQRADAPCLVFIHGGYWQKNSKDGFTCMVAGALARGWSACLPGHTLAPDASMTEIAAEIRAALDYLERERMNLGLNGPVVLGGWSAGAHLCALHTDHPVVDAALLISGIYDLQPIARTAFNDALQLTGPELEGLSPARQAVPTKPCIVSYGANELPEMRRQSLLYAEHFEGTTNAPLMLIPIDGADHFGVLDDLQNPEGRLLTSMELLLRGTSSDIDASGLRAPSTSISDTGISHGP